MQNKMQRRLGQLTGTCFQRCVGMDAINSLHSVTFEIDEAHGTRVSRALHRVRHDGAAAWLRDRRRDDRRQGRSQQGAARAGRSGPVRARHTANGRGCLHQRRQGAPDRLHQFALDDRHADAAPGPGGQGLRHRRRDSGRRRRASPISTAGSPATRGRWKAATSMSATPSSPARKRWSSSTTYSFPGSSIFMDGEVRVRGHAGRALHLLSPPQLRLQVGRRRRADRRGGDDRGLQRRRESLAHPRQARRDDAPQRDHLQHRHRVELPGRRR